MWFWIDLGIAVVIAMLAVAAWYWDEICHLFGGPMGGN